MGDVGSITIGAFFGTLIIIGSSRHNISVLSFICLFGVFIVDSSITIIRRAIIAATTLMIICSVLATLSVAYHDMIELSILGIVISLATAIAAVLWLEKRSNQIPTDQ